jgi:hypothetical protein
MKGQSEREEAKAAAHRMLDKINQDPDSDQCMMARQYLRALEKIERLTAHLNGTKVATTREVELRDIWPRSRA